MGPTFQLLPVRLRFRASEAVLFPPGRPGNIVRGGFGAALKRLVCIPSCRDPRTCERRAVCPYAHIFAPHAPESGPSGLADRPRPFVFRTHHLDGIAVEPGQPFHIDLHLFEVREPGLPHFVDSLRLLASEGLGPRRGRAALQTVELLDAEGEPRDMVYAEPAGWNPVLPAPLELSLAPDSVPVSRVLVRFVTATELKGGGAVVERPEFSVLMARVRDRLSALRALYGPGPLQLDFREFGERTGRVRLARAHIRRVRITRRSSGTGRTHPIGGLVGEVEYEGDLAEFMPYLRAAQWTGVGRQTVWGNGVVQAVAITTGA
jgi:hypothetical protein